VHPHCSILHADELLHFGVLFIPVNVQTHRHSGTNTDTRAYTSVSFKSIYHIDRYENMGFRLLKSV